MKHKKFIAATSILLITIFWFAAVDWSWFVDECPDCLYGRDVAEYRICGQAVHQTTFEYPSVATRIAIDFGIGCLHPNMQRWHKHRWWGLFICKAPCLNGVYRLTGGDSWYNEKASAKLATLADNDSTVKLQFAERVLKNHDLAYVRMVLDKAGVDRDEKSAEGATK